jgi:uncharacterized protein YggE
MASTKPTSRAATLGVAAGVTSVALLVGAFTLGASHSDGSAAQAATSTSATPPAGRITVTGTGTVTGTPNQLMLSMGVQVTGSSVSTALDQANQTVSQVTAALTGRGVPAADIQTSGLYISPSYAAGSQVPDSYQVTESLTATLDQIGLAGGQIQAAVHAGGNAVTVDGVSLNLTDQGPLLAAARANAITDAKARATAYASALGEPLGPVISVTEASGYQPPVVPYRAAANTGSAAVPISPGSQQVTASVTVVFAV